MTCGTVFWSSFHLFGIAVNTFLLTANFLTFLHILFDMVLDLLLFTRKREYYFSHTVDCIINNRECKQRRRRQRRGLRPVSSYFLVYQRNSRLPRSDGSQNVVKLNMQRIRSIQIEIRKSGRRHPRSLDDTVPCHFTLLFRRGPPRKVQRL